MEKLLTISIAAYNVENYIREALDSLVIPEIINELEVFVVDDGGKDGTLSIAKEYEQKYPDTFFAIHKENGGYGSTVNYSIAHATGKYFKLLDGDDWYDRDGLLHLVALLKEKDCDVFVSPFTSGPQKGEMVLKERSWTSYYGKTCKVSELGNEQIPMWALVFRTQLLKESHVLLPEHMLYTDYIYAVVPFTVAETVYFDQTPVYCYRVGREGQSISKKSRLNHFKDIDVVSKQLCKIACIEENKNSSAAKYIIYRAAGACRYALVTLLMAPFSKESLARIKNYENDIRKESVKVYDSVADIGKIGRFIGLMRKTNYLAYWLLGVRYKNGIDL